MENSKQCEGECPKCGSHNIDYDVLELIMDQVYYPATCEDCNTQFKEWYFIKYNDTTYID